MFESLTFTSSVVISATPREVYAVVSDVTRTGEWSPTCVNCTWEDEQSRGAGSWFTGRNETPTRSWETRSQITVADAGRAFGWSVGPGRVNWTYDLRTLADIDGAPRTELTQSWDFLPAGQEYFVERFGADAPEHVRVREASARADIPKTLAAIKRIVEDASARQL